MNAPIGDRSFSEGAPFLSPVRRVLALGYYDGPTEGLLQCEAGGVHRFEMLAWDSETQDVRSLQPRPDPAHGL